MYTITPLQIVDYAKLMGWTLIQEAKKYDVYLMRNNSLSEEISIVMHNKYSDFFESIESALDKLSSIYNIDVNTLVENILTINDDILSIRFKDINANKGFINLDEIWNYIKAIKDLIVVSACSLIDPKKSYRNPTSYKRVKEIADNIQFRQTNIGSFVINIALPIEKQLQLPLLSKPVQSFTRNVTSNIADSLNTIIDNIESDNIEELINSKYNISSNFCDAIYSFYDEKGDDVDFSFQWSPRIPRKKEKVTIKNSYFETISNFSSFLKENSFEKISGTFMATVETLNGDFYDKGDKRCGEVILSLFSKENEEYNQRFTAKANLEIEQYELACEVHNDAKKFLKIAGTIHPGRTKYFEKITEFTVV